MLAWALFLFLFKKVKNMMEKSLITSRSSMFKCFNMYKSPIVSFYSLWFYLRRRVIFFWSLFDKEKIIYQGKWYQMACFLSKNIYLIVQLYWNPSGYYFFLRNRMKALWHRRNKKGFQSGTGYLCFLFLQLSSMAMAKTEIQLSSIFVLKTSKIHLKSVSLLGRETKSILTSN